MNRLYFDTETTGVIPKSETRLEHMPRIVQVAALLCNDDMDEVMHFNAIIKPEGFTIPSGASAIHGITTEFADRVGLPLLTVMAFLSSLATKADVIVAHNLAYDYPVFCGEIMRINRPNRMENKKRFCTMLGAMPIVKKPSRYPSVSQPYGWPSLMESHEFLIGSKFSGAHDALADVRACQRIHQELIILGAANDT